MKLKTIEQLIRGRYINIDLDKTYTGMAMNILNFTYVLGYISYLILKIPFPPTELALKQMVFGAGICMVFVIITCLFGLYFALCETYIGED